MQWLVIVAAGALAFALFLIRTYHWHLGPCPHCQGRRGRGWGSTPGAYNRCHWCGGSGERIRPLSLIWPRWREEARRRREKRK